jgi:hypothetical protein
MLSPSEVARTQGNKLYGNLTDNIDLSTFKKRFNETVVQYDYALRLAKTQDEYFKAKKNLALTYQKMFYKAKEKKSKFEEILFAGHCSLMNYQDSLKSLMTISSPLFAELETKGFRIN